MADAAQRRLVLLGGGHSHALVLAALAARPEPRLRVTLISPAPTSVYSGMLPGVIAGQYRLHDAEIDVAGLAHRAGGEWVQAAAQRIDADRRVVYCGGRTGLPYELLSIDIGAGPAQFASTGDAAPVVSMRPVGPAIARLQEALATPDDRRVLVVGAGAAGCEVACALAARLRTTPGARVTVCDAAPRPLAARGARTGRVVARAFAALGVQFVGGAAVERVTRGGARLRGGRELAADLILWAAGAGAPALFAASGLPTDAHGFLLVDAELRCAGRAEIFATGDCATLAARPDLPKAGVYAVRQAPVLENNLRASAHAGPPRQYRPQRRALALLNTGDGRAILSYGAIACYSRWAWWLKDRIDRRFIARFAR